MTFKMQRYNMIFNEEGDSPGLRVLLTDAYINLVRSDPGLPHENMGDFYSHVQVSDLAQKIYQSYQSCAEELMDETIQNNSLIVSASFFDSNPVDLEKDYIIEEIYGVRLYEPKLHIPEVKNASLTYGFAGLLFAEDIFATEKQGSLQKEFETFVKVFENLAKGLNSLEEKIQ